MDRGRQICGSAMACDKGRLKFGFNAGSCQMASFGVVSASAKAKKLAFGFLSVSAETDIDFWSSAKDLF